MEREQVRAIVEAAMVAAGFRDRGATINGVAVDMPHTHNDILIDALFQAIETHAYDAFYDPSSGLPSSPSLGDTYIATATANGWTEDYVYSWDGSAWSEIVPVEGWLVWIKNEDKFYKYDGSDWSDLMSGTHYHTGLAIPGETSHAWYIDTDGGLVSPNGWKLIDTATTFDIKKWDGEEWVSSNIRARYVP